MGRLRIYARLGRVLISLVAGFSAMTGYILAAYSLRPEIIITGSGVFLLSCGASALNQYQERSTDKLMDRTKGRPLPAGMITVGEALLFSVGSGVAGLFLVFIAGSVAALLLGLFALFWYNAMYTYLKTKTAFAAVPGALVGAVPPAIGWHAAGGGFSDPALIILCLFFFLWQVPHFWLIAATLSAQYRSAGLPAVTTVFSEQQLSRILFIWIASTAVCALFFVPFGLILHIPVKYFLAAASLCLVLQGLGILRKKADFAIYRRILSGINGFMFIILALLFADRIL